MRMGRKVTISDVATAAGVSKATVSRYINGRDDLMSEPTKERIRTVIEMTGYRPSDIARNLKKATTNMIGVIIPDISSPFSSSVLEGITRYLDQLGYTSLIVNCANDIKREQDAISSLIAKGVAGLIVTTSAYDNDFLIETAVRGLPVVLCDRYVKNHVFDIVTCEKNDSILELLYHLKNEGYTKVAMFSEPHQHNSARFLRVTAFRSAAARVYSNGCENNVYTVDEGADAQVRDRLAEFLSGCGDDELPAIFCVNSDTTVMVFNAIEALRLSIPHQIGLCGPEYWGWRGAMNWPELVRPSITTIKVEPTIIGMKSAELLVSKINDPDHVTQEITVPAELCIRDSTAHRFSAASVAAANAAQAGDAE